MSSGPLSNNIACLGITFCNEIICLSSRILCALAYDTSSSAVANRPRDASCLSVVSFNSTKRRVELVTYTQLVIITY